MLQPDHEKNSDRLSPGQALTGRADREPGGPCSEHKSREGKEDPSSTNAPTGSCRGGSIEVDLVVRSCGIGGRPATPRPVTNFQGVN